MAQLPALGAYAPEGEKSAGHSVMEEWVMGSTEEGVKRAGSASGIQRRSNRDARYTFKDFY
jgi:hypothetical protein